MKIHVQWDVNCFSWLSWSWTCCRQHPSLGWQGLGLVRDSPIQKMYKTPGADTQASIPGRGGNWTQRRGTKTSWWLNQPLWQKISQIGNLPQIGVKIKSSWNMLKPPTRKCFTNCLFVKWTYQDESKHELGWIKDFLADKNFNLLY